MANDALRPMSKYEVYNNLVQKLRDQILQFVPFVTKK